jgi:hypothetical protein
VGRDGGLADEQLAADLGVRQPAGGQAEHRGLAPGRRLGGVPASLMVLTVVGDRLQGGRHPNPSARYLHGIWPTARVQVPARARLIK